jgi:hypothetical protein
MNLTSTILTLRDQRVILDADLARIYGVQTRVLNQAVKRNLDKFPEDFMFQLGREEILRISQTVTSLRKLKFSKRLLSPNMAHSWPPQCSTAGWPSK